MSVKHELRGRERLIAELRVVVGGRCLNYVELLGLTIARALREIDYHVRSGRVSSSIKSFADLHDFIDANHYGGAFELPTLVGDCDDEEYVDEHNRFWNRVQNAVDALIKSGVFSQVKGGARC